MTTNSNTNPALETDQTISSSTDDDTLTGGLGDDTINGQSGDDVLRGDGGVEGSWHFETYDRDFSSADGQAFDIETSGSTRTGSGYVTDFDEGGLTNSARGDTGNPSDFGVIYTSSLNITDGGTYRFTTTSDDGSTLQIFDSAGNPVSFDNQTGGTRDYLNNDFHQASTTRFGDVELDPNETYTIQIRYWENGGGDVLSATVTGPNPGDSAENLLTSDLIGLPPGPDFSVTGTSAGSEGDDSIDGGAGNDTIIGDGGDDTLIGGTGNDSVEGGTGADVITGGDGDDTLAGDGGSDSVEGGAGADIITGGDGNDTLAGDAGDDSIEGDRGNDIITGGDGDDTLSGGTGSDSVDGGADADIITGGDGNDTLSGGTGNDSVEGDRGNDTIAGDDGDDTLSGGTGNDSVEGGTGADSITGGDGVDTLAGDVGSDVLDGGSGDDILVGDDGNTSTTIFEDDFSNGAAGWSDNSTENDAGFGDILGRFSSADGTIATERTFAVDPNADQVVIEFDALLLDSWNDGENFIITVNGEEILLAHTEGNTFDPASQSFVDANGATYTFDFTNTSTGFLGGSAATEDTVMNVVLTIDNPPASVTIGFGSDLNSTLANESFAIDNFSIVAFEDSNDTLTGGTGDDTLTGGDGDDVFVFNAGDGNDTITDFNAEAIDDDDQTNNDFLDLSQFYSHIDQLRDDLDDDGILNQSGGVSGDSTALGGTIDLIGVSSSDLTFDNTNVACFTAGCMIETQHGSVAVEKLRVGTMLKTGDNGWQPVRAVLCRKVPAQDVFAPVVISKGTLGNDEDLIVSPAHRMLISDWRAELLFGEEEVLVSAKSLCNGDTIYRLPMDEVTYFHLLMDQHEIIFAAGIPTESYHLSAENDVMDDGIIAELEVLFPELLSCESDLVRPALRHFEVQALKVLAA